MRSSFFEYRYPLLGQLVPWTELECELASLEDQAAMKLAAVPQRGAKRDFYDLCEISRSGYALALVLDLYQREYGIRDPGHALAALTWFDVADRDPAPVTGSKLEWDEVKRVVREWVVAYAR